MATKTPAIPTFEDAMANFGRALAYRIYCHLPGEIVSFDRTTTTAKVKIGLKQVIPDVKASTGSRIVAYPLLEQVPVFTMQCGDASVGGDPKAGDPCLLAIADRNIDAWYQNGGQQAPLSPRAHDLSDAFCFVGFNPVAKPLVSARLAGEMGLADASAKVVVKDGLINISTDAGATSLLTILATFLQTVAVDPIFLATSPDVAAAAAAAKLALESLLY